MPSTLAEVPRPLTAVEVSTQYTEMFAFRPATEWESTILGFDMPDYFLSFGGLICQFLTVAFDDTTADEIVDVLAGLFDFPPDQFEFLNNTLLPQVK